MKAKQSAQLRRVRVRYGAEDRERLIQAQAQSGLTKRAFCAQRQINLTTFYAWAKRKSVAVQTPAFAQVEIAAGLQAAVEVLLPNGARVGIRHQGRRDELAALIRGVCGYAGGAAC
jgi:transposase-like protein